MMLTLLFFSICRWGNRYIEVKQVSENDYLIGYKKDLHSILSSALQCTWLLYFSDNLTY